ncbi:MAG: hypothetical protein JW993_09315 [Sedimentisphaerales bacterium]|nr:hypothetical protein [Sedimentisphaerales bacterium]
MNKRRHVAKVTVVTLAALLLAGAWTTFAGNGAEGRPEPGSGLEWSPVGTWLVSAPTPAGNILMLHSVHAQDLTGTNFGGTIAQVNTNPTYFGMFPEGELGIEHHWACQTVRVGLNSYEGTHLFYITKQGAGLLAETVAIGVCNVSWTLTGPDTNEGTATIGMYLAAQDADQDGLPDEGQEPVSCMPFTCTSKRLKAMPGCVPTVPPEGTL